jgi:hypothetical protein
MVDKKNGLAELSLTKDKDGEVDLIVGFAEK